MSLDEYSKLDSGANDVVSLGWSTRFAQEVRFSQILNIGVLNKDTVLDVGCGYGDLYAYLAERGVSVTYVGVDKRESAINEARRRYDAEFICGDIFSIDRKFDWVVASGIFCFPNPEWFSYVKMTVEKMRSLSVKGVSVNFLSDLSPHSRNQERKYTKLSEIQRLLEEIRVCRFSILHGYRDNDFTIHMLK